MNHHHHNHDNHHDDHHHHDLALSEGPQTIGIPNSMVRHLAQHTSLDLNRHHHHHHHDSIFMMMMMMVEIR